MKSLNEAMRLSRGDGTGNYSIGAPWAQAGAIGALIGLAVAGCEATQSDAAPDRDTARLTSALADEQGSQNEEVTLEFIDDAVREPAAELIAIAPPEPRILESIVAAGVDSDDSPGDSPPVPNRTRFVERQRRVSGAYCLHADIAAHVRILDQKEVVKRRFESDISYESVTTYSTAEIRRIYHLSRSLDGISPPQILTITHFNGSHGLALNAERDYVLFLRQDGDEWMGAAPDSAFPIVDDFVQRLDEGLSTVSSTILAACTGGAN